MFGDMTGYNLGIISRIGTTQKGESDERRKKELDVEVREVGSHLVWKKLSVSGGRVGCDGQKRTESDGGAFASASLDGNFGHFSLSRIEFTVVRWDR